ncbi:MAG: hypothetical protein Q9227_005789 [Pyrenula ochraceoflavens]
MRFGHTLKVSIYPPWKNHYVDYSKLKALLREDEAVDGGKDWTEDDEERFSHELLTVELGKVEAFQLDEYRRLQDRTEACESKLTPLIDAQSESQGLENEAARATAAETLAELDGIAKNLTELEKFSRLNFTGFYKAVKKHDRRRGQRYRLRPMLQVQLSNSAMKSENNSPQSLWYRLSAMYSFARGLQREQQPQSDTVRAPAPNRDTYSSRKFFVHTDHILEVKLFILRQLPVLIYNPQSNKIVDNTKADPAITSVYFDSSSFDLYGQKVQRAPEASSVRLRWTGKLSEKPEIFVEKKTVYDSGESREVRIPIKAKYVEPFLKGKSKLEKGVRKLEARYGMDSEQVQSMKSNVDEVQQFLLEKRLEPVLRANYTRTAFQIPGDDRVRVSLDTNLALIREDSLDSERPCRELEEWHRSDIDHGGADGTALEYPFDSIRKGEISRFPYALLEIKVKDGQRKSTWLADLMASHLVKEVPHFSKFVNGVAVLFEDYVNAFPFWLSDLDQDIRRDPQEAFEEEQQKQAKRAEDEFVVGSFRHGSRSTPISTPKLKVGSPQNFPTDSFSTRSNAASGQTPQNNFETQREERNGRSEDSDTANVEVTDSSKPSRLGNLLPAFSNSRYARRHREGQQSQSLPPGVVEPEEWIKDSGPVKVEPKVWLANQRTFVKWQHITVLLASLSLALYNAAGIDNKVAQALAIVYTAFAAFAGAWGLWVYRHRSRLIQARAGQDLDYITGPIVVSVGLAVALCLNFGFKYSAVMGRSSDSGVGFRGLSSNFSRQMLEVQP